MYSDSDTIAAIATAAGPGGISIVRVSGPHALEIADKLFKCSGPPPSRRAANTFTHGHISDPESGSTIDEVVLLIFKAPHSYTRQDTVEVQGHGGRSSARRIFRTVLKAGARAAEPGEFTRRAFLNGRIDLVQAEAVADLVLSASDRCAAAAIEQLDGKLTLSIGEAYDDMVKVAAEIESSLDMLTEEGLGPDLEEVSGQLRGVGTRLEKLCSTFDEGRLLREGARVVISGPTNAGKSSLLNALLGCDRSITSEIPGTTRDTVEEQIVISGIPVRLIDTAGLRDSTCAIEREGVTRAIHAMSTAQITVLVLDVSMGLSVAVLESLKHLDPARSLVVLNKTDLDKRLTGQDVSPLKAVETCLIRSEGLEQVRAEIAALLDIDQATPAHSTVSERHFQRIQNALNALNKALGILQEEREAGLALCAADLRTSLDELGYITGRLYSEELLDNIFSRFCIGK
jgi:tRNA modification GTPase